MSSVKLAPAAAQRRAKKTETQDPSQIPKLSIDKIQERLIYAMATEMAMDSFIGKTMRKRADKLMNDLSPDEIGFVVATMQRYPNTKVTDIVKAVIKKKHGRK